MKKPAGAFLRDAGDRLCFERLDVDSMGSPALAARVVAQFGLTPVGDLIAGLPEILCDYSDGNCTFGLEWDSWSGLIVTARTPDAEPLVNSISRFLTHS